jgi:hypothetical protein
MTSLVDEDLECLYDGRKMWEEGTKVPNNTQRFGAICRLFEVMADTVERGEEARESCWALCVPTEFKSMQ